MGGFNSQITTEFKENCTAVANSSLTAEMTYLRIATTDKLHT